MFRIILYGIISLIWMFLAGVTFDSVFTSWEGKKYYIISCIICTISAIVYFTAGVLIIMREVNI